MIVYGVHAPNAPNLIEPGLFGGAGKGTVGVLRTLEVERRIEPDVILVSSPHWMSPDGFLVQASARPKCLHDFQGLPPKLYQVRYDAPGDPELARFLMEEGRRRHLEVATTEDWGLDHGAWAALLHIAPSAKIPVVPLSIAPLPPEDHMAWGEAIASAVERSGKSAAFVSTGSITHRLDLIDMASPKPWPEGEKIGGEIIDTILARRYLELASFDPLKWATVAPEGDLAPLFTMVGALGPRFKPRLVSNEQVFGSVGLAVLEFEPG
jgi:4,5-DOPA dioxygenase extradiol